MESFDIDKFNAIHPIIIFLLGALPFLIMIIFSWLTKFNYLNYSLVVFVLALISVISVLLILSHKPINKLPVTTNNDNEYVKCVEIINIMIADGVLQKYSKDCI